jgi:DoxX-like family
MERAMSANAPDRRVSLGRILLSAVLGNLVILFLLLDGASNLISGSTVTGAMDRIGYGPSEALERAIGIISIACAALAVPPTSILSAILWAGYFGNLVITYLHLI